MQPQQPQHAEEQRDALKEAREEQAENLQLLSAHNKAEMEAEESDKQERHQIV